MVRKSQQVEVRLLSEYLVQEYSKFPTITNQPLGIVSAALMADQGYEKAIGMMRPLRPKIDAIVILPRYLLLIEAKVWSVVNGLAKLPLYKALVPVTPELKQYMPREVIMQLVVAWSSPNLEVMASAMDVDVKVFSPDWIQEVVNRMHLYWTAEYQANRQQKLQMREYFGVD